MPVTRDMLLAELKELQRLTAFEQAVATVRRSQAATEAFAQELADNATKSGERLSLLAQAVRGAGGTPDVVGPVLGKLGALVQTQVNQVQTLQGALLGDLALEHQLRERARYARTLAVTLGEVSVLPVLDRLDGAHTETIAWLERRLGEVARTGSSALKATPVQVAVGQVRRVAGAPFFVAAEGVNRVGALVGRLTRSAPAVASQVQDRAASSAASVASVASVAGTMAGTAAGSAAGTFSSAADTLSSAASSAAESVSSAADTVTETAAAAAGTAADTVSSAADTVSSVADTAVETVSSAADTAADTVSSAADTAADSVSSAADTAADSVSSAADRAEVTASDAADAVGAAADTGQTQESAAEQATHEALEASGGDDVSASKPPFAGYERLSGDLVMRHVDDTEDVDELRTLLAFEQAHKARKGVLKAVQSRLTTLSA